MVLSEQVVTVVRFSEVDSLTIVWHGNYAKYFEDGREAFGRKYGLGYLDMFHQGYVTPLVDLNFEFKRPLHYNDRALITTTFIDSKAAKIIFEYKIENAISKELVATGRSTQVFLTRSNSELCIINPEFFEIWKSKWGL
jgi:acyl-CoA thioester hydrolase